MTQLSDFPPDVQAASASEALKFIEWLNPAPDDYAGSEDVLARVIASAIMADRAGRHSAAGLTAKQHELLTMIAGYQAQRGQSPTFAEMRDALGLVSVSGVHRLIRGLEERGRIKRLPNRSRAITIIANPASQQEQA